MNRKRSTPALRLFLEIWLAITLYLLSAAIARRADIPPDSLSPDPVINLICWHPQP